MRLCKVCRRSCFSVWQVSYLRNPLDEGRQACGTSFLHQQRFQQRFPHHEHFIRIEILMTWTFKAQEFVTISFGSQTEKTEPKTPPDSAELAGLRCKRWSRIVIWGPSPLIFLIISWKSKGHLSKFPPRNVRHLLGHSRANWVRLSKGKLVSLIWKRDSQRGLSILQLYNYLHEWSWMVLRWV